VGTLTHSRRGDCLYIQEQAVGMRVGLADDSQFAPGDVVEVSGFIDSSRVVAGVAEAAVMTGAIARKLRSGEPPSPRPIVPADVVRVNAAARTSGLVAEPGDFDGVLVTFPARLVEAQQTGDGGELVLASGDLTLHALAGPAEYPSLRTIEIGSQLQVTGVLQMHLSEIRSRNLDWRRPLVQRMGVLLRSADDVAVVARPTWWNRRRLAAALSLVAAGLSLALAWVWSLRKEVAAQARRIREEMRGRREAAVEYQATLRERNRLAANLHDTLLQSLSALGLQLQSCELSGRSGRQELGRHLGLARTMVDDAVSELRGSVWSLRSIPLKGKSFAEAVESLGRHVTASTAIDVATRVDPDTPPVPDFVAGNLLLVLQEAMHNAVRHADPQAIRIAIASGAAADSIALTITDDGRGFTPGRQAGPEEGHFGLSVMRERIERLGGRLELESGPGHGTTIHVTITLSPHDADFESG
jgi:signal transduction histidine kinase